MEQKSDTQPQNDPYLAIHREMLADLLDHFSGRLKPAVRAIWFFILLHANWKKTDSQRRGQLYVGRHHLARETGFSEQTVRTILRQLIQIPNGLEILKSNQKVTSKLTSRGTLLTIVNYHTWVGSKFESNQQTNQKLTTTEVDVRTRGGRRALSEPLPPPTTRVRTSTRATAHAHGSARAALRKNGCPHEPPEICPVCGETEFRKSVNYIDDAFLVWECLTRCGYTGPWPIEPPVVEQPTNGQLAY